ncbi:hypothetical protein ID866_7600 [Astraeus odoratus]|nr:hypothetical protein ID866_7600 [Astraeus odoratus]
MENSTSLLEGLANKATEFCLNLNGTIELHRLACRGGTAVVHRGTYKNRTEVAVKTISCILTDMQTIKRVLREAHVWSKLVHENVLPLMGITTDFDNTVSIVSRWMVGGNAHDYVQDKAIDPRSLLLDIAKGLQYLHDCDFGPLCHGDLRGLNVSISGDGRALLSFGVLSFSRSFFGAVTSPPMRTVNWSAPELLNSESLIRTPEVDIWAFGMTVLELLTRKPPYHGLNAGSVLESQILRGPPSRPHDESTCSRLTDEWWEVCSLCWQCDPSSRPRMSEIVTKITAISPSVHTRLVLESEVSQLSLYTSLFTDGGNRKRPLWQARCLPGFHACVLLLPGAPQTV